jgi:copper chaperone
MKETLAITGMGCDHCVVAVRDALSKLESVEVEQVEIGSATVEYNPEHTSRADLVAVIEEEGYSVQSR